jgi:hypothetical protein
MDEITKVLNENNEVQVYTKEVDCPVKHGFSNGVYLREIFMPQGSYVIGKEHTTQHFNIILKGSAYVMMNDDIHFITAPTTFVSEPGTRKVLYIIEDMIWQTVHPTEETDIDVLEETLVNDVEVDVSKLLPPQTMIQIGDML